MCICVGVKYIARDGQTDKKVVDTQCVSENRVRMMVLDMFNSKTREIQIKT